MPLDPGIQAIVDGLFDFSTVEIYDSLDVLLAQLTLPLKADVSVINDTEAALPPHVESRVYASGTPHRARIRREGNAATYDVIAGSGFTPVSSPWTAEQRITAASCFATVSGGSYTFALNVTTTARAATFDTPEAPRNIPNFDYEDWTSAPVYTAAVSETPASAVANAIALLSGPVPMAVCQLRHDTRYNVDNLDLPNFGQSGRVKITTDGTLPSPGVRMLPSLRAAHQLPELHSTDQFIQAVTFQPGAQGYRLHGLAFTYTGPATRYEFINTGRLTITTLDELPHNLSIRQCFFDGSEAPDSRIRTIVMTASVLEVVDCWMQHINYGGVTYSPQSQAVSASSSMGRHRVENNYMWGCLETVAYGGGGQYPAMTAEQLCVADFYMARNYCHRPPSLKGKEGSANFVEFKTMRRACIEKNIFDYCWYDLQYGFMGAFWSVNQFSNDNEKHVQTCDVDVRYNWFRNCASGFSASGRFGSPKLPLPPRRIRITQNLATGFNDPITYNGSGLASGYAFLLHPDQQDLIISRNTFGGASYGFVLDTSIAYPDTDARYHYNSYKDNVIQAWTFMMNDGIGTGQVALDSAFAGDSEFSGNVCHDSSGSFRVPNPGSNFLVSDFSQVGFRKLASLYDTTLRYANIRDCAIDGTYAAKGCDVDTLYTYLAGVEPPLSDLPESGESGGGSEEPILTTIRLSPDAFAAQVGDTQVLTISGLDQFGAPIDVPPGVVAHSTSPSIASAAVVSGTVHVSALGAGQAIITVTSGSLVSTQSTVTVSNPPVDPGTLAILALGPAALTGKAGGIAHVSVAAFDALGAPLAIPSLIFHTTNPEVSALQNVSQNHLNVTLLEAGICDVWVTSGDVTSNRVTLIVNDPQGGKGHNKPK